MLVAGTLALSGPALGGEAKTLWLSEAPPSQRLKTEETPPTAHVHTAVATSRHDHGSTVETAIVETGERSMNRTGVKHLWLRVGEDPMRASFAGPDYIASSLKVVGADGSNWSEIPSSSEGRYHVEVPLEEMGFYNAYLTECAVDNGALVASVAKAELLKGTCCKKGIDPLQEKAISDDSQPIELVRDHMPDEKLFTRLVSGDKLKFTVKSFGEPLPGASVTLKTQQGWQKTLTAGQDGRVEFTMIRDYFPDWEKFYRLNKQTFLIVAQADVAKEGNWHGQAYRSVSLKTSLAGKYSPSPYDYRSYAFGLGISVGVIVFLGTAIYIYRRRRLKPFKEIRFHETA